MAFYQRTIEVTPSASLSANGNTTATGSMSWSVPAFPEGVSSWDSVALSGSWAWGGRGKINSVTVDGKTVAENTTFDLTIAGTSPVTLTCKGGNKNATGSNFTWTGLKVTYTYTIYVIEPPVISITAQDKERIGVADVAKIEFKSSENLQYWEARATFDNEATGHGIGLLVESGGTLGYNDTASIYVETAELTNGDREYRVDIFGQSVEGLWSDG